MTLSNDFPVFTIDHNSPHLEEVIRLWRIYSDTLGHFPKGAFDDHAKKRQIIVALNDKATLVGYLMYRQTQRTISIVHLCIDQQNRGQGLAKRLFAHLRTLSGHAEDIRLTCRRDYEANSIWPRLGFQPVYEKPGRGSERKLLTIWRYELQRPPLLAAMYKTQALQKISAVVDANVFYDLQDMGNEETNGLTADFVDEAINLCITGEMSVEIHRHEDPQERQRRRGFLQEFEQVVAPDEAMDGIFSQLKGYHPRSSLSDRDRSDLRHLAHAIGGSASLFITRDDTLLGLSERVHAEYGINILRPCDVVIRLDEIRREDAYRPQRLSGSGFKIARIQTGEYEHIVSLIREPTAAGKNEVATKLRRALSRPVDNECFLVKNHGDESLAVYCMDYSATEKVDVSVLRLLAKNSLSNTLARGLLDAIVNEARRRNVDIITVSVENLQSDFVEALREASFLGTKPPIKLCIPVVDTCNGIAQRIHQMAAEHADVKEVATDIATALEHLDGELSPFQVVETEKLLWPAKIIDERVSNFIVPIRAKWAQELFDTDLARQTLFGAHRPELIFNTENVFYRAARPRVMKAPARVLWYVSRDGKYQGAQSVRACSYVDEVLIGKPKELFRQFRRLGVYRWEDVFELTEQNLDGELMAFRFSRTELFHRPVDWHTLQQVLRRTKGRGSQIQSPESISSQTFLELYRLGTQRHNDAATQHDSPFNSTAFRREDLRTHQDR